MPISATPNSHCPQGGPGEGVGGMPGAEGENCEFLGNVLIIQEPNDDVSIPDDNVDGGVIFFDFTTPAQYIYDMRFIDIDYASSITVYYLTESGDLAEKVINLRSSRRQCSHQGNHQHCQREAFEGYL